jgi:hypothetical protein
LQRRACTVSVDTVVIVPGEFGVVDRDTGRRKGARAIGIVDIAGIVFIPRDDADCGIVGDWNVDIALAQIADAAIVATVLTSIS